MGRIKTAKIKRITNEIMKRFSDSLTENFEENKKAVSEHATFTSKKLRNTVAGYVTRLIKNREVL